MNPLNLIPLLSFFFTYFVCSGQLVRDQDVDESTVKPWIEDSIFNYSDKYIFQPNDGNYLIIVVDDTNVTAQVHFPAHWVNGGFGLELGLADSSEVDNLAEYITLTGVKIKDGKFYSDQYKGEFISFYWDSTYHGIKIYDSWSIWEGYAYEIGVKCQENLNEVFYGKYPEDSLTLLDSSDVASLTKAELLIMRNEIYARYSYRFKEGGDMDKYFSQQEWYIGHYGSVEHMFTWLEVRNIALIAAEENSRN